MRGSRRRRGLLLRCAWPSLPTADRSAEKGGWASLGGSVLRLLHAWLLPAAFVPPALAVLQPAGKHGQAEGGSGSGAETKFPQRSRQCAGASLQPGAWQGRWALGSAPPLLATHLSPGAAHAPLPGCCDCGDNRARARGNRHSPSSATAMDWAGEASCGQGGPVGPARGQACVVSSWMLWLALALRRCGRMRAPAAPIGTVLHAADGWCTGCPAGGPHRRSQRGRPWPPARHSQSSRRRSQPRPVPRLSSHSCVGRPQGQFGWRASPAQLQACPATCRRGAHLRTASAKHTPSVEPSSGSLAPLTT